MRSKHIVLIVLFIMAMSLKLTIANAADTSFAATLTINKPLSELTIGDARGSAAYGDSKTTTLEGTLGVTQISPTNTYTITFTNTTQTKDNGAGLALIGSMDNQKNIIGAVINSMSWNASNSNTPIEFASAKGGCILGSANTSVNFNANFGPCIMTISGSELEKLELNKGRAIYKTTTVADVYGSFSQNIIYTVGFN